MARKRHFWTFQRLVGILLVSGAAIQIYKTITVDQELAALITIASVRHPQLTAASIYTSLPITVLWWILVALLGVFLFVDKNPETFLKKVFEKRKEDGKS